MSIDTGRGGTGTAEAEMGRMRAEGLFVPELALGVGHTHPDAAAAISAYFAAVAAQRPAPLCPATAWNALFYGWDLESGAYTGWGLDVTETVRHLDTGPAVPVGAFVMVSRGVDSVWGEVVYKEGRHPDIDADWGDVPAAISGGTATDSWSASGPVRVVNEALIVDFDALGGLRDASLERLTRHGKYLDPLGHVVVESVYDPPADAEATDTMFFARWLWATQRPVLRNSWLGACLDDRDDDEALWAALVGSLEAVAALLDATPGLAAWGPYHYSEAAFWARSTDLPLGISDGASITHRLASPGRGRVTYRTLRHQLVDLLGDGDAEIRFAAYATAVCHANRMVADTLAAAAPTGTLMRAGVPVYLRLDDRWQSGGVWRTERLEATSRCPLLDVDPTEPLGLGAAGEATDVHTHVPEREAPAPKTPTAEEDTSDDGEPDATVEDSHVHWVAALGAGQHRDGTLRVPTALAAGEVIFRLAHDGDIADDERVQRVTNRDGRLEGVAWPFDFYPGIRLWCVTVPGSSVVHAATAGLAEPIIVDGEERWFASDPERTVVPPSGDQRAGPVSLVDLAVNALRRYGVEGGDGRRSLTSIIVTELIFGPGFDPVVIDALDAALERSGRTQRSAEGRWSVSAPRHARGGGLFGPETGRTRGGYARLRAGVRRAHWVPVHLRRLTVSERANAERRAQWPAVRAQAANRHALPERLPDGYTYVVGHRRGTH